VAQVCYGEVMSSVKLLETLKNKYGHLEGEALLAPLLNNELQGRIALVSSFGTEAALLLDIVAKIDPSLPVILLDTQMLFPETLAYHALLKSELGLKNIHIIYPDYVDTSRRDPDGTLWRKDTHACCYIRKVKPLQKALKNFDAWITGRKRFQGGLRTNLELLEASDGKIKINPLAKWSAEKIEKEFKARNLPQHPLKAAGYLSIGCVPCTSIPDNQNDQRGGRWKDQEKTECGIHLGADGCIYPNR